MQNTDRSYLLPGVPMALASAILFGASTPFSKLLLGEVDPSFSRACFILVRAADSQSSISGVRLSVYLHRKRRSVRRIFRGWQP